ncbi:MAG: exodeoxyribonuclease VII large subunit, partial [Candidatus Eisenbacteria bacterium]|nr:exodeoxyribonuclease VII large subunit [Candidatus Latescibacterota bacterium]MBD3302977.1 exodeoxyribonuclease VII large subunit [Candidatus Eisenbacteria bacterium]
MHDELRREPPPEILTVSEALALAKDAIEIGVGPLWVDGELSGFKRHRPSGHLYFDLKDNRGRVSCVMWRERARRLRFDPTDGMQVRVHGRFGIYEVQGRLQVYADALEPAGLGELQAALERLKTRLAEEGLFASERKRALPPFPSVIGVATSDSGAALRDVLRVLGQRWPIAEVLLRPCAVQGASAAPEIAGALEELERREELDLILLVRGGGSIEDLWCFNEERVVRAIAGSRVPVVTGIGHEIDVTLADFAADLRAATPSQAAELSVPDREEIVAQLRAEGRRLRVRTEGHLRAARLRVARIESSHGLRRSREIVRNRAQRVDELAIRLGNASAHAFGRRRERLAALGRRFR